MRASIIPVAPFAGAWIEISVVLSVTSLYIVAPFAGAWIEIGVAEAIMCANASLRSPERGLKFFLSCLWPLLFCRSVRRSVD